MNALQSKSALAGAGATVIAMLGPAIGLTSEQVEMCVAVWGAIWTVIGVVVKWRESRAAAASAAAAAAVATTDREA